MTRTRSYPSHAAPIAAALALAWSAAARADDPPAAPAEGIAFFEKAVRPVLVAHCYSCHAAGAEKGIKGGLTLDTREGLLLGGELGEPAIVPGDPEDSPLILAVRHADDALKMPPKSRLPDPVIADLVRWVKMGAPDPRDGRAPTPDVRRAMTPEEAKDFWAYRPVADPRVPALKDALWPRTDIDRFVLAALEAKGLTPVADADRRTLIRRLTFDLIGLPPTPEEVEAFLRDKAPTADALATAADRLLASPRFGERWGRHWLDVARFAESSGKEVNQLYPYAWRYRDYVIDAFNADLPYDRFVREQIAGDLLPAADPGESARQTIATGYLAVGPKSHNTMNPRQFRFDLIDEQIDAFSQGLLGQTIACARCHDHKFDPVSQADYTALAGIFSSTHTLYGTAQAIQNRHAAELVRLPDAAGFPDAAGLTPRDLEAIRRQVAQAEKTRDEMVAEAREKRDPSLVMANIRLIALNGRIGILKKRLEYYKDDGTPRNLAMGVQDRVSPGDVPVFLRGEMDKLGEVVPRGVPPSLGGPSATIAGDASGRRELAEWIASPENPLTARVMVNRVWHHLFGRGLVPTPDNFGSTGGPPSHPELLDHLAAGFVRDGWSVKRLIRRIVTSHVYRLSSAEDAAAAAIDPDDVLLWRMRPRRLEAEAIRDAILAVSGRLETEPPVGSPVARAGDGPVQVLAFAALGPGGVVAGGLPPRPGGGPQGGPPFRKGARPPGGAGNLPPGAAMANAAGPPGAAFADAPHRSVYLPVVRDQVADALAVFDFAEPNLVVGAREETTVPSQALFLLNSPFVMRQAAAMAGRLLAEAPSDGRRVDLAFASAFGRPPTDDEREAARRFFADFPRRAVRPPQGPGGPRAALAAPIPGLDDPRRAAWTTFCQALFASAEFRYLR